MKRFLFCTLLPFAAGMMCATNLAGLIEVNPTYDYQWWKVWFSLVVGLLGSFLAPKLLNIKG